MIKTKYESLEEKQQSPGLYQTQGGVQIKPLQPDQASVSDSIMFVERENSKQKQLEEDFKNDKEAQLLADLKKAFFQIDVDGSGVITAEELKAALEKLGEDLTKEELENLVATADVNGDGKI